MTTPTPGTTESAGTTTGSRLDEGLGEVGVEVDDAERRRLVEEIDAVKRDETRGSPDVGSAEPVDPAEGTTAP